MIYDVAIMGAGIAGMATAARLQAQGLSTLLLEAHGRPGGCAGYFRRRGFSFDVGATTLVDFEQGGVGGEFLDSIGMTALEGEALPGYVAWLPDRTVTLYRDSARWAAERLSGLGNTPAHRALWRLLDQLAGAFWEASRRGIKMPMHSLADALHNLGTIGLANLPLARYVGWTMGDALRHFGLRDDPALVGLLGMLIEDTVHSTVDRAPLINAALGITIRGAGLTRHRGGMYGFWRRLVGHYRALGGDLRLACPVEHLDGQFGDFRLHTRQGHYAARQVVSALPAAITARIAPDLAKPLHRYLKRDADAEGGAMVVFLGVPESEVGGQDFTHHQLMQDYSLPLGNGNNMFISVSAPNDTESAPVGCRAVMISTHCELEPWEGLSQEAYAAQKEAAGKRLLDYARRVYPNLGENALVYEIATPCTYEHFTNRPRGTVGGVRQTLRNANQYAIPHDLGPRGLWMVGDSTWPGLGTVACVLGSRIVAEGAARAARQMHYFQSLITQTQ
ncbi:MAG: NAD(P)/FAD-dependent oxidoreductase [Anaerolineae bacterium]|nr:NAD(P)/FAD-dependent oxidoreductase [Anaerolineae bacterium]